MLVAVTVKIFWHWQYWNRTQTLFFRNIHLYTTLQLNLIVFSMFYWSVDFFSHHFYQYEYFSVIELMAHTENLLLAGKVQWMYFHYLVVTWPIARRSSSFVEVPDRNVEARHPVGNAPQILKSGTDVGRDHFVAKMLLVRVVSIDFSYR